MRDEKKDLIALFAEDFICPITQEMMEDPVVAADGHTYERKAFEQWIATRGARAISPMTAERLAHRQCESNILVKKLIDQYRLTQPERKQQALSDQDLLLAIQLREEELQHIINKKQLQIEELTETQTALETRLEKSMTPKHAASKAVIHIDPSKLQVISSSQNMEALKKEYASVSAQLLILTTSAADLIANSHLATKLSDVSKKLERLEHTQVQTQQDIQQTYDQQVAAGH